MLHSEHRCWLCSVHVSAGMPELQRHSGRTHSLPEVSKVYPVSQVAHRIESRREHSASGGQLEKRGNEKNGSFRILTFLIFRAFSPVF